MTSRMRWGKSVLILPLLLLGGRVVDAKTTVTNFKLKGDTVTAFFQGIDPLYPCLENLVSVTASDLIEKDKHSGKTSILRTLLEVIQRDVCTDVITFSGEGEAAFHTFQVAGDLGSAKLAATVPVVAFQTPRPSGKFHPALSCRVCRETSSPVHPPACQLALLLNFGYQET